MIALVLEAYGAFCLFSLIAFLVLASVARLRPDLDEPEIDLKELKRLKKLINRPQSDFDPAVDDPTPPDRCAPAPNRAVKRRSRLFLSDQPLFQTRKHRPT
jgi:hypothetical protein